MKRLMPTVLIFTALLLCAGPLQAADLNIVVVDAQRLLFDTAAGKAAASDLASFRDEKQAAITRREASLTQVRDELSAKGAAMSADARDEMELQYQGDVRALKRYVKDAQDEMKQRELSLVKPIREDLNEIVKEYAKQKGVDLILDSRNPGIAFASERIDVTDEIIALYDKRFQERKTEK